MAIELRYFTQVPPPHPMFMDSNKEACMIGKKCPFLYTYYMRHMFITAKKRKHCVSPIKTIYKEGEPCQKRSWSQIKLTLSTNNSTYKPWSSENSSK
jgi:hypothetical protein